MPRSNVVWRTTAPSEKLCDGDHRTSAFALFSWKSSFGAKPSSSRCSYAALSCSASVEMVPPTSALRSPCAPPCTSARHPVARGVVRMLITPAIASEPYSAENGPRTISICSTPAVEKRPQS